LPVSACRGIGIDIEELATPDSWEALRGSVVSSSEYALLEALAHRLDLAILLTLVFSAKESYFKATFATVGQYFDFDALTLQAIDTERCELTFVVAATLCAEWRCGQQVRIAYSLRFTGCVATLFAW
jgi:4'-phosphopantetheinyl transferase EntD